MKFEIKAPKYKPGFKFSLGGQRVVVDDEQMCVPADGSDSCSPEAVEQARLMPKQFRVFVARSKKAATPDIPSALLSTAADMGLSIDPEVWKKAVDDLGYDGAVKKVNELLDAADDPVTKPAPKKKSSAGKKSSSKKKAAKKKKTSSKE
jgi:hypothetical protein